MSDFLIQLRFIVNSGRLIIADPCVFEDTNNAIKLKNVRKGIWMVYISLSGSGCLDHVVARHETASVIGVKNPKKKIEIFTSQIGLFDASIYRKDKYALGMPMEAYETENEGDFWFNAMCHIVNNNPEGLGAFGYGINSYTRQKSHIVIPKKSWDGEYIEVEILKK
jgi:hypothetical protein